MNIQHAINIILKISVLEKKGSGKMPLIEYYILNTLISNIRNKKENIVTVSLILSFIRISLIDINYFRYPCKMWSWGAIWIGRLSLDKCAVSSMRNIFLVLIFS